MDGGTVRLFSITPKNALFLAALAGIIFLVVVGLTYLAIMPTSILFAPRSMPRSYSNASLILVIEDLEKQNVIPAGTEWNSDALKERKVTLKWLFPCDRAVLAGIAEAAGVEITYPIGTEGQLWGPITIREAANGKGRVLPCWRGEEPYKGVR